MGLHLYLLQYIQFYDGVHFSDLSSLGVQMDMHRPIMTSNVPDVFISYNGWVITSCLGFPYEEIASTTPIT